jgi:hypothetical protein
LESVAQWIFALNEKLASGMLKDVELGGCELELHFEFSIPGAVLTVSHQRVPIFISHTSSFQEAIAGGHALTELGEPFQSTHPDPKILRQVEHPGKIVARYYLQR